MTKQEADKWYKNHDMEYSKARHDPTVAELIELLKTFPQDARCTYDYGLGLEVEYCEDTNTVDFR